MTGLARDRFALLEKAGTARLFGLMPRRLMTMPYILFHKLCPEVAEAATRTITLPPGSRRGVPPGNYGYLDMFCNEPDCDCRRVMFCVVSSAGKEVEAVIAWGWEDRAFYARWFGRNDPETVEELKGPVLNLASPQSRHAETFLQLAKEVLLTDPAYVERVKRHYALFREQLGRQGRGRTGRRGLSDPDDAIAVSKRSGARRGWWRKKRGPGSGR